MGTSLSEGRGQGNAGTCPELEGKHVVNCRLSPQPGAPGHHILPLRLWDLGLVFFFQIYCVRIHPHGQERKLI